MAFTLSSDEYVLGKCLRDTPQSDVWGAVRASDGREVVLKAYTEDRGRALEETRVHAEFEALRAAAGKGIPAALELRLEQNPPVLVLERAPGVALAHWMREGVPLDPAASIEIGLQVADALTLVHAAHLIHRDVTPDNVLVEPRSLQVHLIDFGIARPLGMASRRADSAGLPETFAGTLSYVAPEQTGWMNRGCDFRSDLYSLGATLYQVLTGRPPFEGSSNSELIHAHIARVPAPPIELCPALPEALSRLVLKLLRKEPEERYQSAQALHSDLRALGEQLARCGSIEPGFELGMADAPDQPRFSRRLYGREAEVAQLQELYARALRGGTHAVLVRGEAGVGKSALVEELRPQIGQTHGYLALGKFDLYRDRPYAGWVAALESLVQQLLVESDERMQRWRDELRAGLGNVAQALVDLVPDLQFITGEVLPVPPLGPSETQARLSLALQRFLRVCATRVHPLVIFLDDVGWSDAGSRFLLEDLLSGDAAPALLLIAAYRSTEVDREHPLHALIERLEKRGVAFERLDLRSLSGSAAVAMLADALERTPADTERLAALIELKTANIPLLIRQFVDYICERDLLRYEPRMGWTWDSAQIAAAEIPDGAVALVTANIERLAPGPRSVLKLASCAGGQLDVELLRELGQRERSELVRDLYDLCAAGLLVPCPEGFRFAHDRIREGAQSLLSDSERTRLHWETARLLLARTPDPHEPQSLFEIVEHLNRGLACLGEDLHATVIRLNLRAGQRALATGVAATALRYLAVARELFRETEWQADAQLGFELHLCSAESSFQCAQYPETLALLDALDRRALSRLEFARVAVQRMRVLALTRQPEETTRYALDVLRRLGVRWPMHPSTLRARLALWWVRQILRRRDPDTVMRRAETLDPSWFALLLALGGAGPALMRVDRNLAVLASCTVLRNCLRHGYVARPGFTLASFAVFSYMLLGDAEGARDASRAALVWNERVPDPLYSPRTEFAICATLQPWLLPRRQALAQLPRIAEMAREVGDPEFANYAGFLGSAYLALAGDPVPLIARRLREVADEIARSGHQYPGPGECHGVMALLLTPLADRIESILAASDARLAGQSRSAEPYVRTLWLMVLCVHGRFDLAFAQSQALGGRLVRTVPFVHVADHTFYRGLASAALATQAVRGVRRRFRGELRRSLRSLRRWARWGPDFAHMTSLLEAETARLQGDPRRARTLYERAAQKAAQQNFPHHAALAHERRARMLTDLRRETEAASAFAQAISLYREWGAASVAAELELRLRSSQASS